MLEDFRRFIGRHDLCAPGDRILVAVSGGVDSMVLLDLFQHAGFAISAAHCNFQLRGKESDGDEAFVEAFCKQHGIGFYSRRFDTKNYAGEQGLSIQMAARNLRYEWFDELISTENFHWLATAHHLDDNIETVLLRWIKGADPAMLVGIPRKNGRAIRPLLFATREEILRYAESRKMKWRDDSSNSSDDYARNFVRHEVIPKLKEVNPSLAGTFEVSLEKLRGANELTRRALDQLKDSATRLEGERFQVDINILLLLENPAFACHEWMRPFGFDWDRCVQMVEAARGQPGKRFLSATHEAVIDREQIICSPLVGALSEILIEEGQDKAALGPWVLTLRPGSGDKIREESDFASIDLSKIRYPMVWRPWKSGDAFYPLGLGHRKKISDFLIDRKVPMNDKNHVTVLESGNEVVWVVGYRMDERFKVTSKTQAVLEVHLTRI